MSEKKSKYYTKLTIEVNMPHMGLSKSSITRDAWDLNIRDIQALLEMLLMSSGYDQEVVSSIFSKNDEEVGDDD
jgi:hypothetical protein